MEEKLSTMDIIIKEMFIKHWCGESVLSSLENMKKQLYKSLKCQVDGYWSGHSAYQIMVNGGFLIDGSKGSNKKLTAFGEKFMEENGYNISV